MAKMTLVEALAALDPKDNGHWTADGLPALKAVAKLMDVPEAEVQRAAVAEAVPGLSRESAGKTGTQASAPKTEKPAKGEKPAKPVTLEDLEQAVNDAEVKLYDAQKGLELAQKNRDAFLLAMDKAENSEPEHIKRQKDIMDFLASEQRQREERAQK